MTDVPQSSEGPAQSDGEKNTLYCSFCGKSQHEVKKLIAGPTVFICDECVEICADIIDEEGPRPDGMPIRSDIFKMGLSPMFKRREFEIKLNHVFFACPFSDPFNSIYFHYIKPAAEACAWTIERADDYFSAGPVLEQVWERINECTFLIADLTGQNPNVMYEIGIAHTVGRPVMLITQSIDDIPFDLRHLRYVHYHNNAEGLALLVKMIQSALPRLHNKTVFVKPPGSATR